MSTAVFLKNVSYVSAFTCVAYDATRIVVRAVLPTPADVLQALHDFNGNCVVAQECRDVIVDYFGLVCPDTLVAESSCAPTSVYEI
eukprot:55252-Chlamydomonas_euryale.AAC.1